MMARREIPSYIGLGSNLDEPVNQVQSAIDSLASVPSSVLETCSSLYRNPPMGPPDQHDYVNAVARLRTRLDPQTLLKELQGIERSQGRVRDGKRWGPRIIDLDLLIYGDEIIDEPGLHVPHAGLSERAFVLIPLSEIDPHISIPGRATIGELLAHIDRSDVIRIEEHTSLG